MAANFLPRAVRCPSGTDPAIGAFAPLSNVGASFFVVSMARTVLRKSFRACPRFPDEGRT